MDGPFYVDTRAPWLIADPSAVTLNTGDQAIVPLANLPVLGSNYWWIGKSVRIRMIGRMSPAATPGTATWDIYWGSGASAAGVIIGSSAAFTLVTATNLTWLLELYIRCRALGPSTSGSLLCTGIFSCNNALVASTGQSVMIPASAPAAVGVDTTVANVISPQIKTSLTTCTIQVHDYIFEAMN